MISEINSENKVLILHIMRSVCVCLDILLKDPCAKEKLKFHAIDNIIEILIDDKHTDFRNEILKNLDPEDAITFKMRHKITKVLPEELVYMTTELVAALQRCENKFINDFVELMANEDPTTRTAANGLLQHAFDEEITNKYFNSNPDNDACITNAHIKGRFYLEWCSLEIIPCYGGYGYGGYGYGHCDAGEVPPPCSINTAREEQAELWDNQDFIWLNQSFVHGVRNAEGIVWCFKNPNNKFTAEEGRAILSKLDMASGDHDQLLFRALAHTAVSNPEIYNKIKCK